MKQLLVLLVLLLLIGLNACAKRYTCPTYLHHPQQEAARWQNLG